jgi:hypothetical protein
MAKITGSIEEIESKIRKQFEEQFAPKKEKKKSGAEIECCNNYIKDIFLNNSEIVIEDRKDGKLYRVGFTCSNAGDYTFDPENKWKEVILDYTDVGKASKKARAKEAAKMMGIDSEDDSEDDSEETNSEE